MQSSVYLILSLFLSFSSFCHANSIKSEEDLEKLHRLLRKYSGLVIPNQGKVVVYVQMYVRSLYVSEDPKDGLTHFGAVVTYRERWQDDRLVFPPDQFSDFEYITVPAGDDTLDRIWNPDTFFSNEAFGGRLERQKWDRMQRIYPNGTVLLSVRFKHAFLCRFDHTAYPYGIHQCSLRIESYGQVAQNVQFEWYSHKNLSVSGDIDIPGYELVDYAAVAKTNTTVSTGTYSFIQANFIFMRKHGKQEVAELYVIPASYVLVSWVAFVIPDWEKIGLLLMAVLLGLYNVAMPNILENHPLAKHSYAHTWLIGCSEFLQAELLVIFVLALVTRYYEQLNVPTRRLTMQGSDDNEFDTPQLVHLPPRRKDGQILRIARYCILGIFVFAFCVWGIVASSKLIPGNPGWPQKDGS